jgi:hypothetical protein
MAQVVEKLSPPPVLSTSASLFKIMSDNELTFNRRQ